MTKDSRTSLKTCKYQLHAKQT